MGCRGPGCGKAQPNPDEAKNPKPWAARRSLLMERDTHILRPRISGGVIRLGKSQLCRVVPSTQVRMDSAHLLLITIKFI